MERKSNILPFLVSLVCAAIALLAPQAVFAHCDGMDGPVVKAAQRALAAGNVNLVLIWVQKKDEAEIRQAFEKTLAVRKLSAKARELADRYFFETLVRIHRAGEGAPYTGLKPAGRDLGPAIPAADKALESGSVGPLLRLVGGQVEGGIREHFEHVSAQAHFKPDDLDAGRAYVNAYVEFLHYVEGIHQATKSSAHGHFGEAEE